MKPGTGRLMWLGVVGLLAGAAVGVVAPWQMAVLAGWVVAATAYLAATWHVILTADGSRTQLVSTREDDSPTLRGLIVVGASVMSLVGVALALHKASQVDATAQTAALTTASIVTVVVSWLAINTDYTLRYAHVFYSVPVGGVEFGGTSEPDYRDFAYLAFTIGMTYQVSDTDLLTSRFRRVLLVHALVSYLFGVVIIASVINVSASFIT